VGSFPRPLEAQPALLDLCTKLCAHFLSLLGLVVGGPPDGYIFVRKLVPILGLLLVVTITILVVLYSIFLIYLFCLFITFLFTIYFSYLVI